MGVIWDLLRMEEWQFYIHYGKHLRRDGKRDPYFNARRDTRRHPRWKRDGKRWGDRFIFGHTGNDFVFRRKDRFREKVL